MKAPIRECRQSYWNSKEQNMFNELEVQQKLVKWKTQSLLSLEDVVVLYT